MRIIKGTVQLNGKERLRNLVIPGCNGVPVYDVFKFLIAGFTRGVLVTRASSIAFNMLMAILPASIFLFTLIPFIPIPNFQNELIRLFESILPENAYSLIENTLIEIVTKKSGNLLFFMFLATVIFSTNGIHAVIHSFVVTSHSFKSRTWVNQRKISIVLLLLGIIMIALAAMLIIFGQLAVNRLVELGIVEKSFVISIIGLLKWVIVVLLLFLAISFLYYLAPAKKEGFRFVTPGSVFATVLFILTSLGFSAYVNHFGQYNRFYGWIGTLMVIMVWLYLNSIALLLGFELNVSIKDAMPGDSSGRITEGHKKETG